MARHMRPRPSKRWEGEYFITAPLAASAVLGGKQTTCRVCGRELRVGDVVMSRSWRVGHSCVTCGWTTLEDLRFEPAWERALAKKAMSDHDARRLADLGVVTLDEKTKRMAWTVAGQRLRDEAHAASQTAANGERVVNHGGRLSPPLAAVSGAATPTTRRSS